MFFRFERIVIALIFALLFAGITLVAVSAEDAPPPPAQNSDCASCHAEFQTSWHNGAHGSTENGFMAAWNEQGKPTACLNCHVTGYDETAGTWAQDGVACASCHTDSNGSHPQTPMSVNTDPNACGSCHTDTRFGFEESTHYAVGVDCAVCHDPHSTELKFTVDLTSETPQNESNLCMNCHKDMGESFNHTLHSQKDVTCVDCHLTASTDVSTGVHQVPDHSFAASLTACNACHAEQMHTDKDALLPAKTGNLNPPASGHPKVGSAAPELDQTPKPVSPLGYAGITALIGLAAGMLLSPWLERGYKFVVRKSEEVPHDR